MHPIQSRSHRSGFSMNQVIRWSNNDILINNTVRISEPYRSENVSIDPPPQSSNAAGSKNSAKGDNDTKTHIIKMVNVNLFEKYLHFGAI